MRTIIGSAAISLSLLFSGSALASHADQQDTYWTLGLNNSSAPAVNRTVSERSKPVAPDVYSHLGLGHPESSPALLSDIDVGIHAEFAALRKVERYATP